MTDTADVGFLNARQEAFCRHYVSGGSAAAAARTAGYSETTARAQAARLLHQPAVQDRIAALRADSEEAQGALCSRLLAQTEAIRAAAMSEKRYATALRAVNTSLKLVQSLGMPAIPPDTHDLLLDQAAADAAAAEDSLEDSGEAAELAADDSVVAMPDRYQSVPYQSTGTRDQPNLQKVPSTDHAADEMAAILDDILADTEPPASGPTLKPLRAQGC